MATPDDPGIEASEVTSSALPTTAQTSSSMDLILRIFGLENTEVPKTSTEKPAKFLLSMIEQSDPNDPIVLIRLEFPKEKPLIWYFFPSRELNDEHVCLRIPEMKKTLPTVKSVDCAGQQCLISFLESPQSDVPILIDHLTKLFAYQPTEILFNNSTFSSWRNILSCPFVYKADNLHIENALDANITMQILDQRVTLNKVTSFTTLVLHEAPMLTGTHLSFVRAESIQIGKNVMSPGEVLTEAQRHLSDETGVTTTFIVGIEGWTSENVEEFTNVLELEKFDWDSNRNFEPAESISLRISYKSDLWWIKPEETPGGSHHWIIHFFKSSTDEFIRLQMDKWKVKEVQEPVKVNVRVARQPEPLEDLSDESDSEEEVVWEEDEFKDDNDENYDPLMVYANGNFEEWEVED